MKTSNHPISKALLLLCLPILFTSCNRTAEPPQPQEMAEEAPKEERMSDAEVLAQNRQIFAAARANPDIPTYDSLKSEFKTGDILLFMDNLYALSPQGVAIMSLELLEKLMPYTHVGIIFDLPENEHCPAGLYFWQAAPPTPTEPDRFGIDYIKGVPSDGAQMVSLDTMMQYLRNQHGSDSLWITYRPLVNPLTPAEEQAMFKYASTIAGRSFSYPVATGMTTDYAAGALGNQTGNESFFCSKLASQTFEMAGLIDSVVTNSVLPGHFGPDPHTQKIIFTIDNSFGDTVTFSPF